MTDHTYEAIYTDGDCQSFVAASWVDANEQALGHEDPAGERMLFSLVDLNEQTNDVEAEATRQPNPLAGLCADLTVEGTFPFESQFAAWKNEHDRLVAAAKTGATDMWEAHEAATMVLLERAAPALIGLEILHSYIEGDDEPSAADTCDSLYALLGGLGLTVS